MSTPTWTDDGMTIVTATGITFTADAAAFVRSIGSQLQAAQTQVADLTSQVSTLQAQIASLTPPPPPEPPVTDPSLPSEPPPVTDPTPVVDAAPLPPVIDPTAVAADPTVPAPVTDPTPVVDAPPSAPVIDTALPVPTPVDTTPILDWIAALRNQVEADIAALQASVDQRLGIVNASLGGILDRLTTLETASAAMQTSITDAPTITIARIAADLSSEGSAA